MAWTHAGITPAIPRIMIGAESAAAIQNRRVMSRSSVSSSGASVAFSIRAWYSSSSFPKLGSAVFHQSAKLAPPARMA